jgi:hypothetical protein
MRRFVFSFAMLAIASCLPLAAYGDQAQDKKIAETAIQRLSAEKQAGRLKGFSLDLQVENGTLWLSGRVTSKEQQSAALDVVRRVPGVKQVVNDITVAAPTPRTNTQLVAQSTVGSGVTPAAANSPAPAQIQPAPAQPMHPLMQPQGMPATATQRPVAFAPAYSVAMANANFPGHHQYAAPAPMYAPSIPMGAAPARYDAPQMPSYAWPSYASYPNYGAVTYPRQYSASAWPYIGPFYPYPQVPLGWRKVSLEWDDGWWFLDFKDCHHH